MNTSGGPLPSKDPRFPHTESLWSQGDGEAAYRRLRPVTLRCGECVRRFPLQQLELRPPQFGESWSIGRKTGGMPLGRLSPPSTARGDMDDAFVQTGGPRFDEWTFTWFWSVGPKRVRQWNSALEDQPPILPPAWMDAWKRHGLGFLGVDGRMPNPGEFVSVVARRGLRQVELRCGRCRLRVARRLGPSCPLRPVGTRAWSVVDGVLTRSEPQR